MEEINSKTISYYKSLRKHNKVFSYFYLAIGIVNFTCVLIFQVEPLFIINMLAFVFCLARMQKHNSEANTIDFNIKRYEYLVNLANKYSSKENFDRVQTLFDQSSYRIKHGLDWESSVERLKAELDKEFGEKETL